MSNIRFIVRYSVFWWIANCLSNSFPWIQLIPMLQTWTFSISQNVFRRFLQHSSKIVFVFCALDHSPYPRMIWILTTNPILFRRPQWRIAVVLLFVEGKQRVSPFYHPSIHQFSTLEKTKLWVRAFNKLLVVVPWRVICVTANNGCPRSIIFLSFRTPGTLTFITSLPRAFWCRRWQSWGSPCNQTYHWSWLCCDSFFTWVFLRSFWHHCRINCRTEMANVEQTQKMIPFVTCEISLG